MNTLEINNVRNLLHARLDCSDKCNLIIGPNGSGKTSLLESIHLLSQGKSFRNSQKKSLISESTNQLTVSALIDSDKASNLRVGISKYTNGKSLIKISGEKIKRISQITSLLPVCVIEPNSIEIIEGSPSFRRQVIDWGVFHVEHSFVDHWRNYSNALRQRNALLKTKPFDQSIAVHWENILIPAAETITTQRNDYFKSLGTYLTSSLAHFFPDQEIAIELLSGWDDGAGSFRSALSNALNKDCRFGNTSVGPHKADLVIRTKDTLAKDHLSRGQKKIAIFALRLAQIDYFQAVSGKNVSLLLDDLPSELDEDNCLKVCEEIKRMGCQVFITSIDSSHLIKMIMDTLSPTVFHVKHGTITV